MCINHHKKKNDKKKTGCECVWTQSMDVRYVAQRSQKIHDYSEWQERMRMKGETVEQTVLGAMSTRQQKTRWKDTKT